MSAFYVDTGTEARSPTGVTAKRRSASVSPVLDQRGRSRRLGPGKEIPYAGLLGPALLLVFWVAGFGHRLHRPADAVGPLDGGDHCVDLIADGRLQSNLVTSALASDPGPRPGHRHRHGAGFGLAGLSRWGEAVIDGPVQIKRAVPTLALIPLLILWFGIGEGMKVTVIALGVVDPDLHPHP